MFTNNTICDILIYIGVIAMEDEDIEIMYRKPETILIVKRNPKNTYVIKRENGSVEIVTAKYIRENYETRWED